MIIIGSTIICGPDTGALSPPRAPPRLPCPAPSRPDHHTLIACPKLELGAAVAAWRGRGRGFGRSGATGQGRARAGAGGRRRGAPQTHRPRPWTTLRRDCHITTANSQRTHDSEARRATPAAADAGGAGRGGWAAQLSRTTGGRAGGGKMP